MTIFKKAATSSRKDGIGSVGVPCPSASAPNSLSIKKTSRSQTPTPVNMSHLKRVPTLCMTIFHSCPISCTSYAKHPRALKRGKEAHQWKLRRKGVGLNYHTTPEKDVCRVTPSQVERAKNYGDRIHAVKHLLAMQKLGDNDIEDPRNFPEDQRVLTVIRTGSGSRDT